MTPGEFLELLDHYASESDSLRQQFSTHENELCALEANRGGSERDGVVFNCMLAAYEYLSHKFRYFWFESVEGEQYVRQHRPAVPIFSPLDFEQLVRALLYFILDKEFVATKASYDEGVDLFCREPLYFGGQAVGYATFVVQCKLFRGFIPVSYLRDFFGVVTEKVAEGYFVTTGQLTPAGLKFISAANKSPRANSMRLVDKDRVSSLLDICDELLVEWRDGLALYAEDETEGEVRKAHDRIEDVRLRAVKMLQCSESVSDQRTLF